MDTMKFHLGDYKAGILLFLFSLVALEILVSWKKNLKNYDLAETGSNLVILAGHQLSRFVFTGYQLWILNLFASIAIFSFPRTAWSMVLAFVLVDFSFYVYHYLSHKLRVLWAFHLVHHSSPWMNLTTAYRLNWMSGLVTPLFFFPLVLLGFSPSTVAVCAAFNLLYQFFLHTELVPKLGWIEKIFNTPSHHRVHHGSNGEYLDKNFGGVFIIWDRLFGTFCEETTLPVYGITTGFVSHNPFVLVFHGFADLIKGKLNAKG